MVSEKLHISGIAGTFMGDVAALARELGKTVEGSDQAVVFMSNGGFDDAPKRFLAHVQAHLR